MASDSRLSGNGYVWDDCPKLMLTRRRDLIVGFAGATGQAYPLLLQISNAISNYRSARDGHLEFFHLIGHLERVVTEMMHRHRPDPAVHGAQPERPEFSTRSDSIVIGGYSRGANGFAIRRLEYDKQTDRWAFTAARPTTALGLGRVVSIYGDRRSRSRYLHLLRSALEANGTLSTGGPFGLEPLEVLAQMLRMPSSYDRRLPLGCRPPTVGGAPQVARVVLGADASPFAVRWSDSVDYIQGRPVLGYERLSVPLLSFDHDRLQIYAPDRWPPPEGSGVAEIAVPDLGGVLP